MLTENQYLRQGSPPYFSNFVVLTMGSTSLIDYLLRGGCSPVRCFAMNSLEMPLKGLTVTRQLYQPITEMPKDEKHTYWDS
jgi:hypothetical protein